MTIARVCIVILCFINAAQARDPEGNYAKMNPGLHAWFERLTSGEGMCCSFADGKSVETEDWGTQNKKNSHYWVKIDGKNLDVPDDAVITEPNKFGPAVVWPYLGFEGTTLIRCFMPGAES